jgi:YidC/Oxa1 family membrane protein insertase
MNVFFDIIAQALAFIYKIVPNYAAAITGLTLVIMAALTPLTLKGTRSMMVMQQLQPEMKRIQSRYKDDRQKQNEELLKFYKENDISPLGGCLPLLVQMPVFIVLYAVLRGLTRRASSTGFNVGFGSGQLGVGTSTTKIPPVNPPKNFDPSYLRHNTELYQNLSHTNTMQALGMDLSQSASSALRSGVGHAAPYFILIAVVALTGWVQQRQIQGRTPQSQTNQQQQQIMKLMPLILPVISFGLPAGLVLYFAVSNTYRVAQQWFIGRSLYGDQDKATGGGTPKAKAAVDGPKGSGSPKASGGASKAAPAETATEDRPRGRRSARNTNGDGDGSNNGKGAKPEPAKTAARGRGKPANAPTNAAKGSAAKTGSRTGPNRGSKPTGTAKPASKRTPADGSSSGPGLQPRARKRKQ